MKLIMSAMGINDNYHLYIIDTPFIAIFNVRKIHDAYRTNIILSDGMLFTKINYYISTVCI